jgi:signal transduction histidine kinase
MKRKKKYNPTSHYNPVVQKRKIDKLAEKIENHRRAIQAISRSHDIHISYLGNFAKHDIKNAIQSMDSILSTTNPNEFDEEKIRSLSEYLKVIRSTMDNFAKLVPYSASGKFTLTTLMLAVELLTRADMQKSEIDIKLVFPKTSEAEIHLPFHGILQMLNNVILNSIKSLENVDKKVLLITAELKDEMAQFCISDNGIAIPEGNEEQVFDFGFSTTGGSGIGLYHARYLCDQFKGEILLENKPNGMFTKAFHIKLPILEKDGKDNTDN